MTNSTNHFSSEPAAAAFSSKPNHIDVATTRNRMERFLSFHALTACFLVALAGQIYIESPQIEDAICESWLWKHKVHLICEFTSMGCFFASIMLAMALQLDVDGVPDRVLILHLKSTRTIHKICQVSTYVGVIFMAAGYAIDLTERTGCDFAYYAWACASFFVFFSAIAPLFYLRRKRRALKSLISGKYPEIPHSLGSSVLVPFYEIIPK